MIGRKTMAKAFSKLEIDVTRPDQLEEASNLAKKHSMAALVVAPELAQQAVVLRSIKQAKYKVIISVDIPRGELYCREKFRGVPIEALSGEGYEILLTSRQIEHEVNAEIKYLSEFTRQFMTGSEFRLIMDAGQSGRGNAFVASALSACRKVPLPTCIRNTHLTRIPPSTSTKEVFNKHLVEYNSICAVPIKISGNVDRNIYDNVNAAKFGVSLQQAQLLVKEVVPPALPKDTASTNPTGKDLQTGSSIKSEEVVV